MAKKSSKWIQKAVKHPGALTAQAKRAHKTLAQFMANPPKGITAKTKRRIQLAKTLKKLH